jgi:hypothetical protein
MSAPRVGRPWERPGGPRRGEEPLKIGVEFADGGQAFTGGWVDMSYDEEPARPFVYPGGSRRSTPEHAGLAQRIVSGIRENRTRG